VTSRTDLIIFDCDGVLVDSEVISAAVLIDLAAAHGVPLTPAYVGAHFLGRSFPTVAKLIRDSFAVDLPPGFEAAYRAELLIRFETALRPTAGIVDTLSSITVPFCCATSSSPPRVERSLAIAGLARFFGPRVFTASQVARGKPAPDLFLFAAQSQGARPAACVVIEDSRPGIIAGQAAGMRVLHYTGGSHLNGRTFDTEPPVAAFDGWGRLPTLLPDAFRKDNQ
jgi:HAD superfamily hydrolase (TIGR01509 family)